ncbi:hypothetical protein [Ralstonia mannitolilytica]|uniref:hypothetical protein n=1 Tax=Ralstonia mannitolilytica TaxID=105219 RepID=UPI001C972DBE|nr:hypothetical protein [Ralstonia mannitolilytica]MBY4717583.1 hypothetical protein [Ralstonia mannitolilytica]
MEKNKDDIEMPLAPTLQALKSRGNRNPIPLPPDNFICSRCPKAMWQCSAPSKNPAENEKALKCFCRVESVMTWAENNGDMWLCDGAVEKEDKK